MTREEFFKRVNELSGAWWQIDNLEEVRDYLLDRDAENWDEISELLQELTGELVYY